MLPCTTRFSGVTRSRLTRDWIEPRRPSAQPAIALGISGTAPELRRLYGIASRPVSNEWDSVPLALLLGLRGDAGQRALVAWTLGWPPARTASQAAYAPALLGVLRDDPYAAVRYIAERSSRSAGTAVPATDANADLPELFGRLLRERDDRPVQLLE